MMEEEPLEAPTPDADNCDKNNGGQEEEKVQLVEVDLMKEMETLLDANDDELINAGQTEHEQPQPPEDVPEKDEKDTKLESLQNEVAALKRSLTQLEEESALKLESSEAKFKRLEGESSGKIAEMKRQFAAANRDKESMVVKYALGEKEVIVQRKAKEDLEKRFKAAQKEVDDWQTKFKQLMNDKNRNQQLADSRLQDLSVLKREIDKWKEEVKVQEAKACLANSRAKSEADAHKETRDQLEKTIKHLADTRAEIEITRKECNEFMQKLKSKEDEKEKQTKVSEIEASAKLIIDAAAASELDSLRDKYKKIIEENNSLSQKVQKFQVELLDKEEQIGKLKETVNGQKGQITDLLAQVAEMESIKMQLQRMEEMSNAKSTEVDRLRTEAVNLNEDMSACRAKEAELLQFTQKLTDKNVTLQSDLATAEAKSSALDTEHSRLAGLKAELEANLTQTRLDLEAEVKRRTEETEMLAKKLAEKVRLAENLSQRTTDAENEVTVLKRKNAASLRELTKELQALRKQQKENPSDLSRASSNSSLQDQANMIDQSQSSSRSSLATTTSSSAELNGGGSSTLLPPTVKLPPVDSQVLVEKIVTLQRNIAKKQEKVDFMEEHISTLHGEMQKKNRIIQHYAMNAEIGAMATELSDRNKRKMSESGGIMAAIYSRTEAGSSSAMTLDLSLEINRKLQAVLEDTLLKNITLKENINTLGMEIAKISAEDPKN